MQLDRLMPAMAIAYAGLILLILTSGFALLTKKTVLPRGMFAMHITVLQLVLVLIPDIRQALGMEVSTRDFVLSQGSTNAAFCIWMVANAVWAGRNQAALTGTEYGSVPSPFTASSQPPVHGR